MKGPLKGQWHALGSILRIILLRRTRSDATIRLARSDKRGPRARARAWQGELVRAFILYAIARQCVHICTILCAAALDIVFILSAGFSKRITAC